MEYVKADVVALDNQLENEYSDHLLQSIPNPSTSVALFIWRKPSETQLHLPPVYLATSLACKPICVTLYSPKIS